MFSCYSDQEKELAEEISTVEKGLMEQEILFTLNSINTGQNIEFLIPTTKILLLILKY